MQLIYTFEEAPDSSSPGTIFDQSIPAGTQVDEGTTVTLQVSNGSGSVSEEVPGIESPAPEDPTPTPSPSPSIDPDVKTIQYSVTLPDGDPNDIVKVEVRGSGYDQSREVSLLVGEVVFNITGKGKQKFDIYFDGERGYSIEVNFDTGEVKLG